MKKLLQTYQDRFDGLSLRERLLSVLVVLVVCYLLLSVLLLNPVEKKQLQISNELKELNARNLEIDRHIAQISERIQGDAVGNQTQRLQLFELQQKVDQAQQHLQDTVVQFVRPEQMVNILREVLKQEPGLKLMKVQSTGAVSLFLADGGNANLDELETKHKQVMKLLQHYRDRNGKGIRADTDKTEVDVTAGIQEQAREEQGIPQVYKHGILLELNGNFASTLSYLRMLEKLPWKFYWDAMRFEIQEYPQAKISIIINTLSLDKEWVRV